MNYDWNFSFLSNQVYWLALVRGLWVTLHLTFWAILVGTPLGVILGVVACMGGRTSPTHRNIAAARSVISVLRRRALTVVRSFTALYIDVVRGIPLLVLILLCYYGLPLVVQWDWVRRAALTVGLPPQVTGFQSSTVALVLNLSAFAADLVRGATAGVPAGSILAARSLGMPSSLIWRRIILPDVAREILPSMTLLYISIFKMSTLCSVCAVYELLHTAEAIISQTYKPLELYVVVCIAFVAVTVPLAALARRLESSRLFRRRTQ